MAEKTKTGHNPKRNQVLEILDILNDGVYIVNREYEVEYANAALIRDFGPLENKKCYEYLCNRSSPCPDCHLEEALAGKTIRSEWHSPKTGKIYIATDAPLNNPDGSISKLKITHDITESKRTQQEIRDLSRFPEENPFPVLRINTDGLVLYSNGPGRVLLDEWHCEVGQKAPSNWRNLVAHTLESQRYHVEEIRCGEKIFSFAIAPMAEGGYVNLYGRDVTAGRQAEEALRQSEERLRLAMQTSYAGSWDWDMATDKLNWSPELFHLFGLDSTTTEATFDTWRSVMHPEDRQIAEERIELAVRNRTSLESEYRLMLPSGKVRWIYALGNTMYDNDGRAVRMTGLCIDITERKAVEEALRQSREDLNRAQAVGNVGSWRLDVRKNELTWSEENHRMFGIPQGTPMTYETFLSTIHPDDREYVDTQWKAGLRGEDYDIEHRIIIDGKIKWVREKAFLEFDENGELIGGFGITQDVTRRRRMQEKLRTAYDEMEERVKQRTVELADTVATLEAEVRQRIAAEQTVKAERQRFNDVLETLPVYVCLLTPDYQMPFANRVFREWFGYQADKKCYEFLFNRSEPCEPCETYSVLKTGRPHRWEWTGPNGRNYDIFDFPFKDTDGSQLILEMGIDITERKQAQEALQAASLYTRSLIEASLDPLVTISPDGTITDVNRATELVTGCSREQLINTDFSDNFIEPDRARRGYQEVFDKGFVTNYPLTIRHSGGSLTDVLYNATLYKDSQGKVLGVFAAARDVTELKRAQERIQLTNILLELFTKKTSRKEYLDAIVEVIRDWMNCECIGIRLLDAEGKIPYESWIGFSEDFLAAESSLSLDDDTCLCIRAITQTPTLSDTPLVTSKGSFHSGDALDFLKTLSDEEKGCYRGTCMRHGFASLVVVPIRYRGTIIGAIHLADKQKNKMPADAVAFLESMAMLVGEAVHRFNVEESLQSSRSRLLEAQRIAHIGNWEWDFTTGRIFWSDEVYRIFGVEPGEFDPTYEIFLSYVHPEDRKEIDEAVVIAKNIGAYAVDHRIIKPDGTQRFVHEIAEVVYDEGGNPVKMAGTAHDITEQKQAEWAIREHQQALRAMAAELQLAEERQRRQIAQDLHDSIGPILAFSTRELRALKKNVPPELMANLENVTEKIDTAIQQARTLSFDLSPSLLYDLGLEVAIEDLLDRFAEERKIPCHFRTCPKSKLLSEDVKIILYRSVRELLINAAKHAEPSRVDVSISRADPDICIRVEDDGLGFDVTMLDKDREKKGFGLFSIRERLTHIGGDLKIESAPGKGTIMILTAPLDLNQK